MNKFTSTTLPTAVIRLYWLLVPMVIRQSLSDPPGTSVPAYHAVLAGGGWKAFWWHALPRLRTGQLGAGPLVWGFDQSGARGSLHGGPFDWAHYK